MAKLMIERLARFAGAIGLTLLVVTTSACAANDCDVPTSVTFQRGQATIQTAKGPQQFDVEMAVYQDQRGRGLMCRKTLAPNTGMLFDFGFDQDVYMWMKNTLIPLDMLFIKTDGTIVKIASRAVPMSETTIASGQYVRAVLELPGGTAEKLGIKVGDKLTKPVFAPAK
ncbi:MAG: DUF192 domain-containing protein [Alphaproteobacteria bacterium]